MLGRVAGDPRFHLAAQRTLLAWLRTGIAVMAFGFVMARFGVFERLLGPGGGAAHPRPSSAAFAFGIALLALGVFAIGVGAFQYQQLCRSLAPPDRPARRDVLTTIAVAWALAGAGLLLAMLLLA